MAAGRKVKLTDYELRRAAAAMDANVFNSDLTRRFGVSLKRLKLLVKEYRRTHATN